MDNNSAFRARGRRASLAALLAITGIRPDAADAACREAGESEALSQSAGALEPPYDPEALCLLVEHSNGLNLHAYAVNIDGFGYRLEPAIDFEAVESRARDPNELTRETLPSRVVPLAGAGPTKGDLASIWWTPQKRRNCLEECRWRNEASDVHG